MAKLTGKAAPNPFTRVRSGKCIGSAFIQLSTPVYHGMSKAYGSSCIAVLEDGACFIVPPSLKNGDTLSSLPEDQCAQFRQIRDAVTKRNPVTLVMIGKKKAGEQMVMGAIDRTLSALG